MKRVALCALLIGVTGASAQESGWHFSPYPGEGDRAALGCAYGSTPENHTCIAVRCEDGFSVAVYLDTTRPGGDAGRWTVDIDDMRFVVRAESQDGSAYGARIEGDEAELLHAIKNGVSLFLEPLDGAPLPNNGIGLAGSLRAITDALYFCAPRVAPEATAAPTG